MVHIMEALTIQVHYNGSWHDAAEVEVHDPDAGVEGATRLNYFDTYFFDLGDPLKPEAGVRDARALSVSCPVTLETRRYDGWPPFLVDLLPQGPMRRRIARKNGFSETVYDPRVDYRLLRETSGTPIGNLRVKEAWLAEEQRLQNETIIGVTEDEILARTDRFRQQADRFTGLASGSGGVQGEWPKVLMTLADDGLWYPTPAVSDEKARDHVIVKLQKTDQRGDQDILEAEPPYLEIARQLGLKVSRPLIGNNVAVIIPRFDREVIRGGGVIRHGQESLYTALNIGGFAGNLRHEICIALLAGLCHDPVSDVAEYVARDVVNRVVGNVDNHGRNTAIQRRDDGIITLAPVFDFVPMRLDRRTIAYSTTWTCLKGSGETMNLPKIVEASASASGLSVSALAPRIASKLSGLRNIHEIAQTVGVRDDVARQAISVDKTLLEQLEDIKSFDNGAPHP